MTNNQPTPASAPTDSKAPALASAAAANDPTDNGLWQISAGPYALMQLTLYDAMRSYVNLMNEDAEMKQIALQMQAESNQNQAKAIKKSGDLQLIGTGVGVGFSALGAIAGVGVQNLKGAEEYNAAYTQSKTAESNLRRLNDLHATQAGASQGLFRAGTGELELNEEQREATVLKMRGGDFSDAKSADVMQTLKVDDPEEYLNVKSQLDHQITVHMDAQNIGLRRMNEVSTARQNIVGTLNNLTQAGSNLSQAGVAPSKAQADANAQLDQNSAAMAASSGQALDGQMGKMYDEALVFLQTLQKLEAAGSYK